MKCVKVGNFFLDRMFSSFYESEWPLVVDPNFTSTPEWVSWSPDSKQTYVGSTTAAEYSLSISLGVRASDLWGCIGTRV